MKIAPPSSIEPMRPPRPSFVGNAATALVITSALVGLASLAGALSLLLLQACAVGCP